MNTIDMLDLRDKLRDTQDRDLYRDYKVKNQPSLNNPLIMDLRDLFYGILYTHPSLTHSQWHVLTNIFRKFKYVQEKIDPKRISEFSYTITEEGDLILYRDSEKLLANLIIYPDEEFALSLIHKTSGSSLEYFENGSADYERIVLKFLA